MKPHLQYCWYVLKHKYYVFIGCRRLGLPLWRAITHDWTKFLPVEWFPYVNHFYGPNAYKPSKDNKVYLHKPGEDVAFDKAWAHHWKHNPHHWQYWTEANKEVLELEGWYDLKRSDEKEVLIMPTTYIKEMCADWFGAGMAQGKPDVLAWYEASKDHIVLHPEVRSWIPTLLKQLVA